jgi:hypothetical protein
MAEAAVVDLQYRPHRFQAEIHAKATRFTVIVTHRRFGKTFLSCGQLVDAALRTTKQDARFGYLAPFLKQAKQTAWGYLKNFSAPVGPTILEGELSIRFPNGAMITLFGGDNPEALRGGYFDGLIIDEVADLKPDTWGSIIRPALADRKGWCFFIGTPHGLNLFHDLYQWARDGFPVGDELVKDPEWTALMYRVDETELIDAKELASSKATQSAAQYRQEWLCDFSAASDDVLISIDLVSQACARTITQVDVAGAPKIIGVDVARFGDDRSVIIKRQGLAAFPPMILQGIDNMTLAGKVAAEINAWQPDAVFIDAGRGEGVIDRLRQLGFDVIEVNFGGKPINDRYANKRAEMWDAVAQWLHSGGCLPNDPALKTDLCTPTYGFTAAGKMIMESKDDVKKRGLRSSDVADALCLAFALPVSPKRTSVYHRSRHNNGWDYQPFAELYESAGKNLGWSPARRNAWSGN